MRAGGIGESMWSGLAHGTWLGDSLRSGIGPRTGRGESIFPESGGGKLLPLLLAMVKVA
jgi:hypothetical protein